MHTPWGKADSQTRIASGITFYSTPSHGGIKLSPGRVEQMPTALRGLSGYPDNWYEEDVAYAAVVDTGPQEFADAGYYETAAQAREEATATLNRWYPDELAAATR